jgi:recombination protein RecR
MFTGRLDELRQALRQLPGIGDKSAQRLAMHLLTRGRETAVNLARCLVDAVDAYRTCSVCGMMAETDPCPLCADESRDPSLLCVVEGTQDVFLLEATREYRGQYFVLGRLLSPLDGIGPAEIRFPELHQRVKDLKPAEIILAINPSAEGEATIHYIATNLTDLPVRVTRLSTGIPFGGDIGYASPITLSNALTRRHSV